MFFADRYEEERSILQAKNREYFETRDKFLLLNHATIQQFTEAEGPREGGYKWLSSHVNFLITAAQNCIFSMPVSQNIRARKQPSPTQKPPLCLLNAVNRTCCFWSHCKSFRRQA